MSESVDEIGGASSDAYFRHDDGDVGNHDEKDDEQPSRDGRVEVGIPNRLRAESIFRMMVNDNSFLVSSCLKKYKSEDHYFVCFSVYFTQRILFLLFKHVSNWKCPGFH